MIDIHSHILPLLDDGSSSMAESITMAIMALDSGVTEIIATPHCNVPGLFNNYNSEFLQERFDLFRDALADKNIPLTVYNGMEVFATDDILFKLNTEQLITLNNSRYLLTEFSFDVEFSEAYETLRLLIENKIVPVIAHPERYDFIIKNPAYLADFADMGCKIQLNRSSILGAFGRTVESTAHGILKSGLADVIASDAHSVRTRTSRMNDVYDFVSDFLGKSEAIKLMHDNPEKIVADEPF